MLALALALAVCQDVPLEPGPTPAPIVRTGHLRHVQLLASRDGETRIATSIEVDRGRSSWSPEGSSRIAVYRGARKEPEASLALPTPRLRSFSWTTRPTWHLFELHEATVLACLDTRTPALRILTFPAGEELARIEGVTDIEDALVHDGAGQLLIRSGAELTWARLAPGGALEHEPVALGLERIGAAALERGAAPGQRGWALGWAAGELRLLSFEPGAEAPASARKLDLDVLPEPNDLRLSAWGTPLGTHLVIGDPRYKTGVGRLTLLRVGATLEVLFEGRPDPEVTGDMRDARDYGQCVAFVPDVDGDGGPDVLVSGPWSEVTHVDLLSGATGARLQQWVSSNDVFQSNGHSLSLAPDGRRALLGGARWRNYPEDLTEEGRAVLLSLPQLAVLESWSRKSNDD